MYAKILNADLTDSMISFLQSPLRNLNRQSQYLNAHTSDNPRPPPREKVEPDLNDARATIVTFPADYQLLNLNLAQCTYNRTKPFINTSTPISQAHYNYQSFDS